MSTSENQSDGPLKVLSLFLFPSFSLLFSYDLCPPAQALLFNGLSLSDPLSDPLAWPI